LQEQGRKNIMDSHGHIDEILVPEVFSRVGYTPYIHFCQGAEQPEGQRHTGASGFLD
jgi:hypothetical protein